MKTDDVIIIDNQEIRMKNGKLQVRAKKGIAILESGTGISNGKKNITLGSAFTTTSPNWIDVTGLNLDSQEQKLFWKILSHLSKYKPILQKIQENLPVEFDGFDINLGAVTLHFKVKE